MNFSDVGTALILPRSGGAADLSGHATITTTDGEKGNYTFYSIVHTDANGTTRDNGAAFFHTNSCTIFSLCTCVESFLLLPGSRKVYPRIDGRQSPLGACNI